MMAYRTKEALSQRRGYHPLCHGFPANLDLSYNLAQPLYITIRYIIEDISIFILSSSRFTRRY